MNKVTKKSFKSDKRIKYWEIDSKKGGPSIFVTAGVHGAENTPIQVAFELIDYFSNTKNLVGKVSIAPIVNVNGNIEQTRDNPVDNKNINASGANGNGKLKKYTQSDAIADEIYKTASDHDYYLDMHSASKSRYLQHVYVQSKKDVNLARSFGFNFIVNHANTKLVKNGGGRTHVSYQKNLSSRAGKNGCTGFGMELGAGIMIRKKDVNQAIKGILNFCSKAKILKEKFQVKHTPLNQVFLTDREKITTIIKTPCEGNIYFEKSLGEKIEKGETIAFIVNPKTLRRRQIKSPVEGRIIMKRILTRIKPDEVGETIFRIIPKSA